MEATGNEIYGRRLGRRKPDRRRGVLKLGDYLTGQVPSHPLVSDHLSEVPAWNGQTNTDFGTCGPCSVANLLISTAKYLLGVDIQVTDDQIYDFYRRSGNPDFDPETGAGDGGVDMTVMLSELVRKGIEITEVDGLIKSFAPAIAFASVDVTDIEQIRAATSIFGGVLFGLDLETAQMTQTDHGLWSYFPSPDWGGHAVFGGAYTSAATGADEKIITWQKLVGTTDSFLAHQAQECYAVLTKPLIEHPGFQAGVDLATLAADFTSLTGRPFPVPVPGPPAPEPTPPAPGSGDPDLDAWARVALPWTALAHPGPNRRMDQASTALLRKKGYL